MLMSPTLTGFSISSSIVVSVLVFVVSAEPAPEPLEALFEQAASEIAVKPELP